MMITNNSIRSWCGVQINKNREFDIYKVDTLRANENTLMFVNKNFNIKSLDKECSECVFLLDNKIYKFYEFYESDNGNDFILVQNPKFEFCYVVDKLGLPSRFQYDGEEDIIDSTSIIDPGVIIGGTDFSPVIGKNRSEIIQFPQMGGVKIGKNVLIKYNSMVGKGTFGYTEIDDNTAIDFGCQIGHNCKIGKNCIIAAGTIIGGSTIIGDNTTIGIGARLRNGLRIGRNVSIGMGAVVIKDITDDCVVVGNPAHPIEHEHIMSERGLV